MHRLHPKAVYADRVPSSHRGIPARDDRKEPTRSRSLITSGSTAPMPRHESSQVRKAHRDLVEPPLAPNFAPQLERSLELDPDLRPRLRTPVRLQHQAQDAVDTEPRVPEAGVRHQTSASVIDPLLRHRDGISVGVLLGVAHHVGQRGYMMLTGTTTLVDNRQCVRSPASAVRLVRLRLDHPALVLDVVRHVRLRSLPLRPA